MISNKNNNPSLITKITEFFSWGPDVVLLPLLQWDLADQPNFNEDGFFIDYELISKAHPKLRDRMLYGLHRISSNIVHGIPTNSEYPLTCENFEQTLETLYNMTTEDVIDMNKLNYDWLLKDAKGDLIQFVAGYNLTAIGLTDTNLDNVCIEETDLIFFLDSEN